MSMTHDEMIAVIAAHKAGKTIECRATPLGLARSPHAQTLRDWGDPQNNPPLFNFAFYDYRVAPEPREWAYCFDTKEMLEWPAATCPKCVHVREVME